MILIKSIRKSTHSGSKSTQNKLHQTNANKNPLIYADDVKDESIDPTATKRLTTDQIDICKLLNSMKDKKGKSGATVVFVGSVRNYGKNGLVKEMVYESYIDMAERRLKQIEKIAMKRWDIKEIRIIHRIGPMKLGASSVVIALSTPHSKDAFEACQFILDAIKKEVPIWKKEILSNNKVKWVVGNAINIDE